MSWPEIHYEDWAETYQTLHMWTQIAGKVRMAKAPLINHWWNVVLYVNSRGLGTTAIPDGHRSFEIDFDFIDHRVRITTSDGDERSFALEPMSVATFYRKMMTSLAELGIEVSILEVPQEVPNPIRFDQDETHQSYDPEAVHRLWQALVQIDRVFTRFRSGFIGKVSPVQFFWGSFDLAVTRFSGREAPEHPGIPGVADFVTREAYSHEVSSAGFWPGGPEADAAFYSYAYPEPDGYATAPLKPAAAFYSDEMKEFLLPYHAVREADDPEEMLLEFLQSTYEAAAEQGSWDRASLERRG